MIGDTVVSSAAAGSAIWSSNVVDGRQYNTSGFTGDANGFAVAWLDTDADGLDALVGAPDEDSGGIDAGAVYVLMGLLSMSGSSSLSAADAVITSNDAVNGDGFDDLMVGAIYDDDGGSNAGAAYLVLGLGL